MGKNVRPLNWKGNGLAPEGAALDTVKEEMETSMIDTARDQKQSSKFTKNTQV